MSLLAAASFVSGCTSRTFGEARPSEASEASRDLTPPLSRHERLLPDEDKEIARSVRLAVAKAVSERKDGVTRRDAHPKHLGCLKGEFEIRDDVPPNAQHGLFAKPASYKVWARFSNAGLVAGNQNDQVPDARGIAFKVMGVPGRKMLPGAENSQSVDFLLVNFPFFIADDLKEYNDQLEDPKKVVMRLGEVLRVAANGVADPLVEPYFSITPFALGDTAVKYRVAACEGQKAVTSIPRGKDYLSQRLAKHVDPDTGTGGCFDFAVQFYKDDETTPVEKGTAVWKESKAPFVPIARLTFPNQDISSPEREAFCENVSFNPSRVLEGQHALGSLNRGRREVYKGVAARRHADNKVVVPEPTGDENF
jgi:hypothetical protein